MAEWSRALAPAQAQKVGHLCSCLLPLSFYYRFSLNLARTWEQGYKNGLDKDEIKNLQAVVVTRNSTLTRLRGQHKTTRRLLTLKKMEVLIKTCLSFPVLTQIQKSSFISLVQQLFPLLKRQNMTKITALNDISDKYSSLILDSIVSTMHHLWIEA